MNDLGLGADRDSAIVGRTPQMGSIRKFICDRQSLQIVGPAGVGKTTLLEWTFGVAQNDASIVARWGPTGIRDPIAWWRNADASFGFDATRYRSTSHFYHQLIDANRFPYLFCDEFDHVLSQTSNGFEFSAILRDSVQLGVRFVIASQKPVAYSATDSELAAMLAAIPTVSLGRLSRPDMIQLISNAIKGSSNSGLIDATEQASNGVPGFAQLVVDYLNRFASVGNGNHVPAAALDDAYSKYPWVRHTARRS